MKYFITLVIVLAVAAVSFAGSSNSFKGLNENGSDRANWGSQYASMEPHQVFDGVNIPPISPDLPKEITLAEEPAKDCLADRVIIKSWLPRFLLKSGF